MCGLAGVWRTGHGPELERIGTAMADAQQHRGPDDAGVWADAEQGIVLAHRRLAILDLSPAGAQPMLSACGRYVLVFNGEIYNFAELRADLESRGVRFRGHSDTEVLLAGIVEQGLETTLRRANGMFALALWDRSRRELSLARDRVGEKPLYYGHAGAAFVFASELKALHASPGFRPALDRAALTLYLRYGYVPDPHCIYAGLRKLVPGTFITLTAPAAAALPTPRPYWSLADLIARARVQPFAGSIEAGIEAVDVALRRSVRARMVADVPLGAFLSGGIDSSSVVAAMQAESSRPVRTFSIGFEVAGYDEAPYARAVARHLGTEHTELYVTPAEAQAVIPSLPTQFDEPFADSSQIPTWLVSALARRSVTVAMSGDAGDELFAGYLRYSHAVATWRRCRRVPAAVRRLLARAICACPAGQWNRLFGLVEPLLPPRWRQMRPGEKLHKLAPLLQLRDPAAVYRRLVSLWQEPAAIVIAGVEPEAATGIAFDATSECGQVESMMILDTLQYLPGDILTKVDRASMAVSLEARVPFLDPDLIELAWRLPHAWKLRDGRGKWILRRVLARYVPEALFERPKMGFGVPIGEWLRGPLRDWAESLLCARRLESGGVFRAAPVRAAWQAHLAGTESLPYPLWAVLMFEAWRDRWPA